MIHIDDLLMHHLRAIHSQLFHNVNAVAVYRLMIDIQQRGNSLVVIAGDNKFQYLQLSGGQLSLRAQIPGLRSFILRSGNCRKCV